MKIKVSEAEGAVLDWLVAKCEGIKLYSPPRGADPAYAPNGVRQLHGDLYLPSTDWSQGGPIIEREGVNIVTIDAIDGPYWEAHMPYGSNDDARSGPTPLIAAMRCYVASKLGEEVEVPEELV